MRVANQPISYANPRNLLRVLNGAVPTQLGITLINVTLTNCVLQVYFYWTECNFFDFRIYQVPIFLFVPVIYYKGKIILPYLGNLIAEFESG